MKRIFYLFLIVLLLTGCGDKVPLGGKVTFPDGKPLGAGTVFFTNDHFLARAHLKPDGTFDVGSLSRQDGLPPGTYKVYISGAVESAEIKPKDNRPKITNEMGETISESEPTEGFKPLIAQEFTSEKTTPLSVTVPGERLYNIIVDPPKD